MNVLLDQRVRAIVLRDWDPLDIASERPIEDEYDLYLPQLNGLVRDRADAETLFVTLWRIETVLLRVPGNWSRTRAIAERLAGLDPDSGD